jgi:Na+-transporting methylmalonyl-CoA/oxaloacetate decarboxylase gamma subunit
VTELNQGLILTLWGVGITFLALGLLILIIYILRRLWPPEVNPFKADESQEKRREMAAAIAVAVSLLEYQGKRNRDLGRVLEEPHGRWWQRRDT